MPEIDEDMADEMIAEDRQHIKEALQFNIPPVHMADEATQPIGLGTMDPGFNTLDLSTLVDWRKQHQTQHAAAGVRTRFGEQLQNNREVSTQCQLIRCFH